MDSRKGIPFIRVEGFFCGRDFTLHIRLQKLNGSTGCSPASVYTELLRMQCLYFGYFDRLGSDLLIYEELRLAICWADMNRHRYHMDFGGLSPKKRDTYLWYCGCL